MHWRLVFGHGMRQHSWKEDAPALAPGTRHQHRKYKYQQQHQHVVPTKHCVLLPALLAAVPPAQFC